MKEVTFEIMIWALFAYFIHIVFDKGSASEINDTLAGLK